MLIVRLAALTSVWCTPLRLACYLSLVWWWCWCLNARQFLVVVWEKVRITHSFDLLYWLSKPYVRSTVLTQLLKTTLGLLIADGIKTKPIILSCNWCMCHAQVARAISRYHCQCEGDRDRHRETERQRDRQEIVPPCMLTDLSKFLYNYNNIVQIRYTN